MLLVPDYELFQPTYARGESDDDFGRRVREAQEQEDGSDTLAVLRGKVAGVAEKINVLLIPRGPKDFRKQVALADYLAKQTVEVPLSQGYLVRASTGPITKWAVAKALQEWGFDPARVEVTIKKCKRFPGGECYAKVTFRKK